MRYTLPFRCRWYVTLRSVVRYVYHHYAFHRTRLPYLVALPFCGSVGLRTTVTRLDTARVFRSRLPPTGHWFNTAPLHTPRRYVLLRARVTLPHCALGTRTFLRSAAHLWFDVRGYHVPRALRLPQFTPRVGCTGYLRTFVTTCHCAHALRVYLYGCYTLHTHAHGSAARYLWFFAGSGAHACVRCARTRFATFTHWFTAAFTVLRCCRVYLRRLVLPHRCYRFQFTAHTVARLPQVTVGLVTGLPTALRLRSRFAALRCGLTRFTLTRHTVHWLPHYALLLDCLAIPRLPHATTPGFLRFAVHTYASSSYAHGWLLPATTAVTHTVYLWFAATRLPPFRVCGYCLRILLVTAVTALPGCATHAHVAVCTTVACRTRFVPLFCWFAAYAVGFCRCPRTHAPGLRACGLYLVTAHCWLPRIATPGFAFARLRLVRGWVLPLRTLWFLLGLQVTRFTYTFTWFPTGSGYPAVYPTVSHLRLPVPHAFTRLRLRTPRTRFTTVCVHPVPRFCTVHCLPFQFWFGCNAVLRLRSRLPPSCVRLVLRFTGCRYVYGYYTGLVTVLRLRTVYTWLLRTFTRRLR